MILTTHALVGAAIGKSIDNPVLIVAISLPVHFLLDSIHHGEYLDKKSTLKKSYWRVVLDFFIGVSIVVAYILLAPPGDSREKMNIIIGSATSMFPDFLTFLYLVFPAGILKKIHSFHEWVHTLNPLFEVDIKWSLKNARNDILISLAALALLLL